MILFRDLSEIEDQEETVEYLDQPVHQDLMVQMEYQEDLVQKYV